jgi:very-short-patch-repair endonuclease
LDGAYHDYVFEADRDRQIFLEKEGYRVLRFSNEDVLSDVEAIAIAIRRFLKEDQVERNAD